MKFGNIVQGENLMIFDKDRNTAKLWRKVDREQRRSLRLLYTVGGNLAKLNARTESVFQRGSCTRLYKFGRGGSQTLRGEFVSVHPSVHQRSTGPPRSNSPMLAIAQSHHGNL